MPLAALPTSTWNQQKLMSANVSFFTTGRQPNACNFASIINVGRSWDRYIQLDYRPSVPNYYLKDARIAVERLSDNLSFGIDCPCIAEAIAVRIKIGDSAIPPQGCVELLIACRQGTADRLSGIIEPQRL